MDRPLDNVAQGMIDDFMKKLGITREEALQLIEDDKKIDKGEKLFELSAEQKKNAKKATQIGTKTVKNEKKAPKRKKNDIKALIISKLSDFLTQNEQIVAENVEIVNEERQISFKIGELSYSLTLTQHRK